MAIYGKNNFQVLINKLPDAAEMPKAKSIRNAGPRQPKCMTEAGSQNGN